MISSIRTAVIGCIGVLALAVTAMSSASAAAIPYPNAGTENPIAYTFTASATGDLTAYSYKKSGASYDETLGLLINGVDSGINGLDNHSSAAGDKLDFGSVMKGDVLTFYITVNSIGGQKFYSDPTLNPGGTNQVYSTSFGGAGNVPAGVYVAFEDLNPTVNGSSDFNYQDEEFVFTNTSSVSNVPLPASAPMFGAALAALGVVGYRLKRKGAATA
jgi:hypothetical protein